MRWPVERCIVLQDIGGSFYVFDFRRTNTGARCDFNGDRGRIFPYRINSYSGLSVERGRTFYCIPDSGQSECFVSLKDGDFDLHCASFCACLCFFQYNSSKQH